jgi:DNA-binding PadR family transcriptional regulator
VSPIFRHGRLRLYLLKLLDEAPRHGYEVIRLLQDRFMGVYSPSPGTIYPRLARLEDDGLVTHDEVDGKKVYRITEKGREEIRGRLDDLAELEEELTESVRDIAREVSEDVRDTVRSLREEITWAARDVRREGRDSGERGSRDGDSALADAVSGDSVSWNSASGKSASGDSASGESGEPGEGAWDKGRRDEAGAGDDAQRIRQEARQAREDIRDAFRSQRRGGGGRRRAGRPAFGTWAAGWQDWGTQAGLDKMASEFARDLSHVAGHAGDLGENALGDLRSILADALTRIRDEVFAPARDAQAQAADGDSTAEDSTAEDSTAGDRAAGDNTAEDTAAEDRAAGGSVADDSTASDSTASDSTAGGDAAAGRGEAGPDAGDSATR